MDKTALKVGDEVIHPRYGFGTVESLLAHAADGEPGGAPVQYYAVRLTDGGQLSVPVAQAATLGLRRLVNGVAATLAMIRAEAVALPPHPRHRSMELAARWQSPEPAALASGVRDLLGYAREFGLKGIDQQWLTRACERLGAEAARVDGVTAASARASITQEVARLKTPPPEEEEAPAPARRSRSR